ncbi:MAG: NADH-quinone oxidoreductase subunit J [Alphaproteobacteria bacterium]
MILHTIMFYAFAVITIASAFMVISSRNPVHSVLFLILTFFTAAGLFVLIGAEFLAMIMVIVYVGAVAVLFLFVVMMLDINFVELRQGFLQYLPIGAVIGLIMLVELIMVFGASTFGSETVAAFAQPDASVGADTNTEALGLLIYTEYVYAFQAAGLILLVAMIGAIVLTHRTRPGVKKQNIGEQVRRDPSETIEVREVPPGQGI